MTYDDNGNVIPLSQRFNADNQDIRYSERNSDPKELQLQAIQEANPATDDIHTWVRSVGDIHTFREALDADGYESGGMAPDFTDAMIKRAEKTGRIAVYSSNDIGVGTWVTPSKMEAESYAGGGKVFVKNVKLTDVAWVDSMQGQYTGDVQAEKNTADGGVRLATRYDIVDVNGKEYDTVVQLDKHISKRVISSPVKFLDYIVKHFAGQRINVLDKDGNVETLVFANADDYVSKNGSKRHPVLGELAYANGSTRREIIVNLPEVAARSEYDPDLSVSENHHDWMDKNGWESRKTYVLADDGKIYEAFLRIAKAEDGRNILYAVNCDATKGIAVDEGATHKRAAVIATMPSNKKVSQNGKVVNSQNKREASRYSAETKAAIDAFRAQTDAAAKAQKAVYEAQIQQMEQSYKRQINTLEAEADDRYNDIRMKFNSIVEQYDAKVMEAGAYDEQRNELMQALQDEESRHKSDNEIWQKEFDRLTKSQ